MRTSLFAFVLGCAVAVGGGYLVLRDGSRQAIDRIAELQREVTTKAESLLGYRRRTDYLTAGKKKLGDVRGMRLSAALGNLTFIAVRRRRRAVTTPVPSELALPTLSRATMFLKAD
jgi:hypothetical protein